MVLKCNISKIIFLNVWKSSKKFANDYTFNLNITLLIKTGTEKCWLFISLSRRFLPYNQPLDFIYLEYDDTFALREKRPYSELFWSAFSRIQNEYGEILSISLFSVRLRENVDQNNYEYGHSLRSANLYST